MTTRFIQMASTDSIKAARVRYRSPLAGRNFGTSNGDCDFLTQQEKAFIEARDGFYQATVTENGWPYVQFRGGPAGFLKMMDEYTLGYADFRGNRQYISVGNLRAESRVALILMDYPNRRRLKIWARARVIDEADDPALIAELEMPDYRARVERAVILKVEAYDWNCPQHITPRFSEREIDDVLLAPLKARIDELEQENRMLRKRAADQSSLPPTHHEAIQ